VDRRAVDRRTVDRRTVNRRHHVQQHFRRRDQERATPIDMSKEARPTAEVLGLLARPEALSAGYPT
jgi:hypothetical protein